MHLLRKGGVAAGVVQDMEDHFHCDEQYAAREFLIALDELELGNIVTEGIPMVLSETPASVRKPAPLMGQHTEEICTTLLGMTKEEVKELQDAGVLA